MRRYFTLREAEELLPRIEQLLRGAVEAHSEAAGHQGALERVVSRITYLGGVEIDPADYSQRKLMKKKAECIVRDAVEEIQEAGVLIKDIEVGLIDFPAVLGDREVLLCWKLGEDRIDHWHGVNEGYAGRKPITNEFGPRGSGKPN